MKRSIAALTLGLMMYGAHAVEQPQWVYVGTEKAGTFGTVKWSVDGASTVRLPNDFVQYWVKLDLPRPMKGGTVKVVEQLTYDCGAGDTYVQHTLTYDKGDNVLVNNSDRREMSAPPGSMYRNLGRKMCKVVR